MKAKRFLSFLLSITLILSSCPVAMAATVVASGDCGALGDNVTWSLDSDGTLTVSGNGEMKDYYNSHAPWESNRANIKKIVIDNGVTSIGDWAFRLTAATSVSLPEGLTRIGDSAFEAGIFTSISLPTTLETIDCDAFMNAQLNSVTIPASVTSLHHRAFANCSKLAEYNVEPANAGYCSVDGVLFSKDMKTLIKYPYAKRGSSYVVPEGVETIGAEAFYLLSFRGSITIPKSVKTIGGYAFAGYQCYINSVNYGGTEADRRKMEIGSGNSILTDATWSYTEPDYALSFTDSSVIKGENATVSLLLDTDITVLGGSVTVSAKDENGNELAVSGITPNNIADCTITSEGSKIVIATLGSIDAGAKIVDISFITDDNTETGNYTVTLESELYTGDVDSDTNDVEVDFAVNVGTITVTEKPVTVIWKNDDGTVLETDENVPYGTVPTFDSATPKKASTAQYEYTFEGWTPTVGAVTEDTVYTATYAENLMNYTLTFKNETGDTIKTLTVPYGTEPGAIDGIPEVPEKASTPEFNYIANDWGVQRVTGDATYTASYTEQKRSYTITWLDADSSKLGTTTVEYGTTPSFETPGKAQDVGYTYTFKQWDPALSPVTGEATYTATYTQTARIYAVSVNGVNAESSLVIKDASGNKIQPTNGAYNLTYNQTYSYELTALGYKTETGSFTVLSNNSGMVFNSNAGTAVLTFGDMEKFIGDLNSDGAITMTEAQALYNFILGRNDVDEDGLAYNENGTLVFNKNVADINGNGTVGADDILPMLRLINSVATN